MITIDSNRNVGLGAIGTFRRKNTKDEFLMTPTLPLEIVGIKGPYSQKRHVSVNPI